MQMLLTWAGWAEYQATCLSPILWTIVAMALLAELVGWVSDQYDRRRARARRKAASARHCDNRRGDRWRDAG